MSLWSLRSVLQVILIGRTVEYFTPGSNLTEQDAYISSVGVIPVQLCFGTAAHSSVDRTDGESRMPTSCALPSCIRELVLCFSASGTSEKSSFDRGILVATGLIFMLMVTSLLNHWQAERRKQIGGQMRISVCSLVYKKVNFSSLKDWHVV
ncbi:hypothetical protein ACFE04_008288 [Oxalis oulophora]